MMGIDPSLNSTGIAYWSFHEDDIVTCAIKVKKLRATARLMFVRDAVEELMDFVKPTTVIYEGYAFGAKGQAIFDIGEMGGVLKTLCYDRGVDVLLVPPSTLKLFTTGSGVAKKDQMAISIEARWGREFKTDDEADAFALLKLGDSYFDRRSRRSSSQKVRESLLKCEITSGRIT